MLLCRSTGLRFASGVTAVFPERSPLDSPAGFMEEDEVSIASFDVGEALLSCGGELDTFPWSPPYTNNNSKQCE